MSPHETCDVCSRTLIVHQDKLICCRVSCCEYGKPVQTSKSAHPIVIRELFNTARIEQDHDDQLPGAVHDG